MPNCTRTLGFFHPYFACPFCRFSILVFLSFSFIFSTLSWKWRPTLFVLELRHLFLWSSGHLAKKKKAKLLKKSERWPNKWSKVKTLEDKPRRGWRFFFFFSQMSEKYFQKSCRYMRNNSTKQKVKRISTSHYRSKFLEHKGIVISYQKKLKSLEEKKEVHTSCKRGVRMICQL